MIEDVQSPTRTAVSHSFNRKERPRDEFLSSRLCEKNRGKGGWLGCVRTDLPVSTTAEPS